MSLLFSVDAIGEQGFQLFVDAGQPLDPDLIQALVREVLEEKIATMINNDAIERPINEFKETVRPPQPTPRNIERSSNENLFINRVETPKPTPTHSPETSPRINRRRLMTPEVTPHNSIIEETKFQEPIVVVPQVVEIDEETQSLIETASDDENEGTN